MNNTFEKLANKLIKDAQGQPMIFYLSPSIKPFGVTCGGGYIDSLLTFEEYQNLKRIFSKHNIEWIFNK